MTAYEMQVLSKMVAETIVSMICNDERFIKKLAKTMPKKRMLNSKQAAALLGISQWQIRKIAEELGGVKASSKGDSEKKRWGHYAFAEDGLVERYQEYLRTK